MNFQLLPIEPNDLPQFKSDMQEAFQRGAEKEYGQIEERILKASEIDKSLAKPGAIGYKAVVSGELVGGAVVVIDTHSGRNHLDFLYVRNDAQGKGIGLRIWKEIESLHPETRIWETCTPYFEKRNLHFYINQCGFHAVEFFNPHHKDPTISDSMVGGDYFFRFEKYCSL